MAQTKSLRGQTRHLQLVDSGSDRELVGTTYAQKHGMKTKRLKQPVRLRFMDGSYGTPITHATWQKVTMEGANGERSFVIKYLVANIPDNMVLGMSWLQYANPDIDWRTGAITWRDQRVIAARRVQDTELRARRARQQIIQGDIVSNEPPEWVKKNHPRVLLPQRGPKELPPRRPGFDYELRMKPGFVPKRQPNRSFSPQERRMFTDLANMEREAGRWRFSDSPQAVQMLWAAKAGGQKRPCHDYRPLNAWIMDDAFPIPVIKDLMTDVAGCGYLTSLDLPRAYNELRIKDKATEDLLAFYCNNTLYAPTVVQFGSKTAVAHFQRFITWVLRHVIGTGCHAYLDNIIVYAKSKEQHDEVLRKVLLALEEHSLHIQPKKCEWEKNEVQFCGFLVGKEGIRLDPEKLRAINEWQPPTVGGALGKTKVREFLGFCNFYRDSIPRYSDIAAPLTALTGKAEWAWTAQHDASWLMLKTAVLTAPVRAAYDENLPIEAHTDASDKAIAATIEHRYSCGHTRPLAFYSAKLNPAEQNYTVHDKELLAIVKLFKHFHAWMHGSPEPVKIWSDHKALQHFLTTTKLTQRHARWAETLGQYRFVIQHVKGRENRAADALSRKDDDGLPTGGGQRPLTTDNFAEAT